MNENVIFMVGTEENYKALESYDENTLYWVTDKQLLYRGDKLFAVGKDATTAAAGLLSAEDKGKLDKLVTDSASQETRLAAVEQKVAGVTGAMHFKGVAKEDPTGIEDGYESGDVVTWGEKEYVWGEDGAFHEFGDVSAEGDRIASLETEMEKRVKTEDFEQAKSTLNTSISEGDSTTLESAKAYVNSKVSTVLTWGHF